MLWCRCAGVEDIEDIYVDGVSLTHGHPRQHIWTFAVADDEEADGHINICPCTNPKGLTPLINLPTGMTISVTLAAMLQLVSVYSTPMTPCGMVLAVGL